MKQSAYSYFTDDNLKTVEGRARLLFAFMICPAFYHQEISIYNPEPKNFTPAYLFPCDMFSFVHHVDHDGKLPSLKKFITIVKKADAPVSCIGSHDPHRDRTFQLICFPEKIGEAAGLSGEKLLAFRWLCAQNKNTDEAESDLFDTFYSLEW